MINRVASYDNFNSVVSDLSRTQVKIDGNQEGLASGKRVETAGEDPIASIAIQNAKQEQEEISSYLSNIVLANNRLSNEESVTSNVEDMTVSFKKRCLQIVNGALSREDRLAYAQELKHYADEIYGLSNSRDEAGHYIFSGGRTASPAFMRDHDGSVFFQGDTNVPLSAISSTVTLQTSDSGRNVFYSKNPYGDFQPNYELKEGSVLTLKSATSSLGTNVDYSVTFSENPQSGEIEYQLWDKETYENREAINQQLAAAAVEVDNTENESGTVIAPNADDIATTDDSVQVPQVAPLASGVYHVKEGISYRPDPLNPDQELFIQVEGYPVKDGDRIDLEYKPEINIFDVMNTGIEEAPSADNDATRTARMNTVIREIDSSFVHFNEIRSDIGTRLQTLDTQRSMLQDMNLELEKVKGSLEDLDYTAAVIDYSKNTTALQAAQNAFSKTQQLSLFQYI